MLRLTMAGALLGCTAFVLFLGDVNSQTTTSYSPGPSLDSTTSGETTTTEFIPAPDSTTSFLRTFITNCSGFCNFNLLHVHAESECSCDSKCATIDYGRCCNYLEYCTAPSTTQARTNSQPDKSPSTAAPPDTSSSFIPTSCPSTCGVEGNTCDELASHFTCDDLETTQGCDCTGCLCPVVSDVSSSTLPPDPTTVLTTVLVDTTTSTTTTTTTSTTTTITTTTSTTTIPCPATCYGATCDDWVVFGGFSVNTRCTFLEREHDCDCHKCVCDDAFWSTTEDGTAPTTVALSTEPPVDDTTTSSRDDKNYGVDTSVISGGFTNSALQMYTVISGGRGNLATQEYSTVSGGLRNAVRSNYATVGAGFQNVVSGRFTTIVGGRQNAAAGRHSVVLGSGGTTTGTKLDHVLLMNFRHSSGTPVAAAVDMPNTISLQADEVYFNDVDLNALAMSARRLAESQQQIDDAVRRVDGLKSLLAERLAQLRALTA